MSKRTLEKHREQALLKIHEQCQEIEEMAQRAAACNEPVEEPFLTAVRQRLAAIEQQATSQVVTPEQLDAWVEDANYQSQLSAYMCPRREVANEGALCIDEIEEWNVPKSVIEKLRRTLGAKIARASEDIDSARSALRALFEEYDSWSKYTDEYQETMDRYALWLISGGMLALVAALVLVHFPAMFPAVLLCAGLTGSFLSVLAKMPAPNVTFSGELKAYLQKQVLIRIAVGSGASLVGCALLGWGVLPISIHGLSFTDILNSCTESGPTCSKVGVLVLIAVPLLFGFSERGLTSMESRVFGK